MHNKIQGLTSLFIKRGADVVKTDYTTANYTAIMRAFDVAVNKVYVLRCATTTQFTDVVKELDKIKFNYVCTNVKADNKHLQTKLYNTTMIIKVINACALLLILRKAIANMQLKLKRYRWQIKKTVTT